jgi:hypothetical protein
MVIKMIDFFYLPYNVLASNYGGQPMNSGMMICSGVFPQQSSMMKQSTSARCVASPRAFVAGGGKDLVISSFFSYLSFSFHKVFETF